MWHYTEGLKGKGNQRKCQEEVKVVDLKTEGWVGLHGIKLCEVGGSINLKYLHENCLKRGQQLELCSQQRGCQM